MIYSNKYYQLIPCLIFIFLSSCAGYGYHHLIQDVKDDIVTKQKYEIKKNIDPNLTRIYLFREKRYYPKNGFFIEYKNELIGIVGANGYIVIDIPHNKTHQLTSFTSGNKRKISNFNFQLKPKTIYYFSLTRGDNFWRSTVTYQLISFNKAKKLMSKITPPLFEPNLIAPEHEPNIGDFFD